MIKKTIVKIIRLIVNNSIFQEAVFNVVNEMITAMELEKESNNVYINGECVTGCVVYDINTIRRYTARRLWSFIKDLKNGK